MSGYADFKPCKDNINYKAIACEQIPELFLDKIVAKKHFSKFGRIKRFILRPNRLSCTIEYESKEDAKNAYLNAGNFNGTNFIVGYAEHEVAHVQNTEEWVDPEVQAELEAMSPGHRLDVTARTLPVQKSTGMERMSKYTNDLSYSSKSIKPIRQNSPQPEALKIDSSFRQELEDILRTPAFTYEEKYRVLDARDKFIRMTSVRQTDIKKAVAIKGTCPDMCPEKERLMREFQRQVSIFEMTDEDNNGSTISHRKAVKEYSRSSADQEVPLPHELRSESVLQMTMLYLVHRIMGLCDDPKTSLCDWFHFVWDRTRSIRKDITQQELCSLEAVQLVEQCARFHIHCGARLVAEDPSVFDKKINAENLTKCLQTLKYMYHDLRIKGVVCPCEAEFRSYVILLNLGDSNFLWEVQQLPEIIQKSGEVKRAIAFYNAIQNNNFVRFFSMIKSPETSYMSACILLGYFTKLRVKAMDAIIKSHNWRKNDVYLPLSYLTTILGFDDESSAASFLNYYGLHCELLENRVLLDRLNKPDMEYVMDRALQLVESKRQVSVGECVFGKTLPSAVSFENHQPHSSFDENGMFKIELLARDHHLIETFPTTNFPSKHQQKQPDTTSVISGNETNLFKIPHSLSISLPKPQKRQHLQQKPNIGKEAQENLSHPQTIKKEEKTPLPVGFKLGDNIFGAAAATKPANESIFKTPVLNTGPEQASNTIFQSMLFKPSTENIFGPISTNDQPKSDNIFGEAVKETANLFHQQKKETFIKDNSSNVFQITQKNTFAKESAQQEPQTSTNKFSLPIISSEASLTAFKRCNTSKNEMDNKSVAVGNNIDENFKQINEDKLKNLELEKIREHRKLEEDREREINKLKMILEEKALQTTELFVCHIIEEEIYRLAQTELLLSQTIIEASNMQKEILINEVVSAFVVDIADEEYALMCYNQLLLNRYFTRWLMHLRKKKEQRKLMENIPLWVSSNSRSQCVEAVKHPCQQKNMAMMKRYRLGKPIDLNKYYKMEYDNLCDENDNPLNLFALVGQHLLAKQNFTSCGILQQRKYFKFLITVPGSKEELLGFGSFLSRWLTRLIKKDQSETGPFLNGIEHDVALCVRKLYGIIPKNEHDDEMTTEGDHNDGVVCFITGVEIDTHSCKRLYNLLKLTKNLKRVPLAIVAYNCKCSTEELVELLGLDVLQEEGLIYSYTILGCQMKRRNFSFRKLFIKAVDFITRESYSLNSNEIQALAMQNILSFLESSLGEEMWQRWCVSAKSNPIFNKICNLPTHVLGIFHKALDHLIHITQEDFDEMPEFPAELKQFVPHNSYYNVPLGLEFFPLNWKDKTEKSVIKSFLQSLYLPDIQQVPADIEGLKLWLLNYSSKCVKDDDLAATKASHEAILNLVNQLKCLQDVELSSRMRMINYLPIFKPIIFAHINRMLQRFKKELVNLNVIYLKDDFKNFRTQAWWLNYEPLNLVTVDYSEDPLSSLQTPQVEYNPSLDSVSGIAEIIAKAEETSRKFEKSLLVCKRKRRIDCSDRLANLTPTSQIMRTLDDSLYQFELSKKVGHYDTSFVTDLTHGIDKSISKVLNQSPMSKLKKKRSCLKKSDEYSEVQNVIASATKLIHKIESTKDKTFKSKIY